MTSELPSPSPQPMYKLPSREIYNQKDMYKPPSRGVYNQRELYRPPSREVYGPPINIFRANY